MQKLSDQQISEDQEFEGEEQGTSQQEGDSNEEEKKDNIDFQSWQTQEMLKHDTKGQIGKMAFGSIGMPGKVPPGNMANFSHMGKQQQDQMLQHLGYTCPGLHGEGCRQEIVPMNFEQLFNKTGKIIIPLFQRSYCWGASSNVKTHCYGDVGQQVNLAEGWWRDISKTSEHNPHRVGKIILYRDRNHPIKEDMQMLAIDGQQRITTMQLLLIALRDASLPLFETAGGAEWIEFLNRIVYRDKAAAEEWIDSTTSALMDGSVQWNEVHQDGVELPFAKLIPSFVDRKPFFEMLTIGVVQHELRKRGSDLELRQDEKTITSHQGQAKAIFAKNIAAEIAQISSAKSQIQALQALYKKAVLGTALTYIEMLNDLNLAQVFLWFQEKELLGEPALLYNATPGLAFRAADLVRNLMLSCHMSKALNIQEQILREQWLMPFELKVGNQMDEVLSSFVENKLSQQSGKRHISKLEKMCQSSTSKDVIGIYIYGKFVSLFETRVFLLSQQKGPPLFDQNEQEEQESTVSQVSQEILQQLTEFAEALSND